MEEIERYRRRAERERAARKEAERLAEEKTRELYLANEQMKQFTDHLEQLVSLRTGEIARANDRLKAEVFERQRAEEQLRLLYAQSETSLARTKALYDSSRLLIGADDLETVLQSVVDSVADAVDADRVQLFGLDTQHTKVTYAVCSGPSAYLTDDLTYVQLARGLTGWVMTHREPAVSPKDYADPRESSEVRANRLHTQAGSIVVVPLLHRDRLLGTLTAVNRPDQRDFSAEDVELMVALAAQAAVAIAGIQLLEETKAARIAAENANQAKSRFLANMSHELRTPLNGILGYAQILIRDRSLAPKVREAVTIIQDSGEHLLTLINDILDLSKIEAERMELAPSEFNFHEFLNIITGIIAVRAEEQQIDFNYRQLSDLPVAVTTDEKRLRQVLLNILGNAVKFTVRGSVTFSVGRHYDKIRFEVTDTGVGIEAEQLENIFEPFHQTGELHLRAEGTGLGLAISHRLVEMMGGSLQVESRPGAGSRFWFDLTLASAEWNAGPVLAMCREVVGFRGGSCRILIADDREANRTMLRDFLLPLGFDVKEAVNGKDAVDATLEFMPHLICMDLAMPIVDGFAATETIRKLELAHQPAIIAVSASVFDITKEQCQAIGCDDYLTKPVDLNSLLEIIEQNTHITWIDEPEPPANVDGFDPDEAVAPVALPDIWLLRFQDLVQIGDVEGLLQALASFRQAEPEYEAVTAKLEQLASSFQFEEIDALLAAHREAKT